jgi:large subunit ribosomal protein L29
MKENADKARALDSAELHKQLRESSEQMFRLRFQMSMGQVDGLKKLRLLRREKARMLTVLRERELHPENAAPTPVKKSKAARSLAKSQDKSHDKSQAAKPVKAKVAAKAKAAEKPKAAAKKAPVKKAAAKKEPAKKASKTSKG